MPSILPEFEYDIFISYRQNDNKRDGWVTNFVESLRDELEATLKNPVSIYFDENPHDGLLETHQVSASLEGKLKCIVFMPIISQTYCDENGYAWSQEFLPFIEMANIDSLGMNIPLANGNVVNRILPIRIHDLDQEDQEIIIEKLGGPLRAIDFIYKEPGVNRPLKPQDDRKLNLEKTDYHNQINKVANALKDIGTAVLASYQKDGNSEIEENKPEQSVPNNQKKKSIALYGVLIMTLLIVASYLMFREEGEKAEPMDREKAIAVLPFRNDSKDPNNIYFCNGLMEDIINQLAQVPNLRVPSATSMLYYRDNPKPYEEIVQELQVSYLLEASVRKMANKALMNITLIDAAKNEQIWSDRMEMDLSVKDLFNVQYEVANAVTNKLRIAMIGNKNEIPTANYEAYDNFTRARDLMKIWSFDENRQAINLLTAAIELDSNYLDAFTYLGQAYGQRAELSDLGYWVDSARVFSEKAYTMDDQNAGAICALAYSYVLDGQTKKALDLYLKANDINPGSSYNYAGWCYFQLNEFDKAVFWASENIKNDPKNSIYYIDMGNATTSLGLIEESGYFAEKALEINPNHSFAFDNIFSFELMQGNLRAAMAALKQASRNGESAEYEANQGIIYYKMDSLEQAYQKLSWFYNETVNEKRGDENSVIHFYENMQYMGLTLIKLGRLVEGRQVLTEAIERIGLYVSDDRPQKDYLFAGCYAALGNEQKALAYLVEMSSNGYSDYYAITTSDAFESLWQNDQYLSIVEKIRIRNNKLRDRVLAAGVFENI